MYQGSCLCGKIRYTIEGELDNFSYCHCRSCRKASGSAFAANAGLERNHFVLNDPEGVLREYESSPGKFRAFCSRCGSPLYAYLAKTPELIRLRLGSLDSPFSGRARVHIFVGDKADWEEIHDELPQFEAWPGPDAITLKGSRQPE